jgi:hypothetical protein
MNTAARATELWMLVENMMSEAINSENKETILNLIRHLDLNINFPVNENNLTFLMWAITTRDHELAQVVFNSKSINFEIWDNGNNTISEYAAIGISLR